jgi:hypothetical protein
LNKKEIKLLNRETIKEKQIKSIYHTGKSVIIVNNVFHDLKPLSELLFNIISKDIKQIIE